MSKGQLNSVDKLHANLLEIGKHVLRLKWLVVTVSVFFAYFALRYDSQPQKFEISFLGKLSIDKTDIVLSGPFVVAILTLALRLTQLYGNLLFRHFSEAASQGAKKKPDIIGLTQLLRYPTTDLLLVALSVDNNFTPFLRKLVKVLGFVYRISFSVLPVGAYFILIWKGFRYSPSTLIDYLLYLSTVPFAFSLAILFHHEIALGIAAYQRFTHRFTNIPQHAIYVNLKYTGIVFSIIMVGFIASLSAYTAFLRPAHLSFSAKMINIFDLSQSPIPLSIQFEGKQVQSLRMITMTIQNRGRETAKHLVLINSLPDTSGQVAYSINDGKSILRRQGQKLIPLGSLSSGIVITVNMIVTNMSEVDFSKVAQYLEIVCDNAPAPRLVLNN